jgi:hypothetical protein
VKRGNHRTEVTEGKLGGALKNCFGEHGGFRAGSVKSSMLFLLAYFRRQANSVTGKSFPH